MTELYSIGRTHQERDLWCLEITNEATPKEGKTGIGVLANIHGGERESAASGLYTAWWLTLCSSDEYVKSLLDNYVVYVVPVINPDGYEQSFVINTRQNLRPRDLNGDGIPFSDPYTCLLYTSLLFELLGHAKSDLCVRLCHTMLLLVKHHIAFLLHRLTNIV